MEVGTADGIINIYNIHLAGKKIIPVSTIEEAIEYRQKGFLVAAERKGQVVSLESTTYPGTTEEELLPRIEETNLKVGKDVFLIYSPF